MNPVNLYLMRRSDPYGRYSLHSLASSLMHRISSGKQGLHELLDRTPRLWDIQHDVYPIATDFLYLSSGRPILTLIDETL